MQDTVGTVKWIYDWAGLEISEVFEERMVSWLEQSEQRRKQNPHKYTLEQFGLTEKAIRNKFENYYVRYREYI
jgi:hypothetical protein